MASGFDSTTKTGTHSSGNGHHPADDQARRFLTLLFKDLPENYVVSKFVLWPDNTKDFTHYTIGELARFIRSVEPVADKGNFYSRICPMAETPPQNKRGDESYTTGSHWVWSEWDDKDTSHHLTRDELIARLLSLSLPDPTMLVDSGHGWHIYWRLSKFCTDLETIKRINKGIRGRLGAKDGVFDMARVLRIPGTMNLKELPYLPVRLEVCEESRVYGLDDFPVEELDDDDRAPNIDEEPIPGDLEKFLVAHDCARLWRKLSIGVDAPLKENGYVERSGLDWTVCLDLMSRAKFTDGQCLGVLLSTSKGWAVCEKTRERGIDYARRTVHKARRLLIERRNHPGPRLRSGKLVDPKLGEGVCPWLDDYIEFGRKWAPRSYDGFHMGGGLFVMSTLAARRVKIVIGRGIFTSLYILLAAATGQAVKTEAGDIAKDLLDAAGLGWRLLPDNMTPEAFIAELSGRTIRERLKELKEDAQEEKSKLQLQSLLSAQRGWFYEEYGESIQAMMQAGGPYAAYRSHLRRLYNVPDRYEYATIGRGKDTVENPYLALLGLITPSDLKPFAKAGSILWGDGFLARYGIICAPNDEIRRDRWIRNEVRTFPKSLIDPLIEWNKRLGLPGGTLVDRDGARVINYQSGLKATEITYSEEVFDAYYAYNDALLDEVPKLESEDLKGGYIRFHDMALKIAALITSLNGSTCIELPAYARAQGLVEEFRHGLHRLQDQIRQAPKEARDGKEGAKRAEPDQVQALIDLVKQKGPLSKWQIFNSTHWDQLWIAETCAKLVGVGIFKEGKNNRNKPVYECINEDEES